VDRSDEITPQGSSALHYPVLNKQNQPAPNGNGPIMMIRVYVKYYVLDLRAEILGETGRRQSTFDWPRGDRYLCSRAARTA